MIRIVAENLLLFLLPTLVYVGYVFLTRDDKPGSRELLSDAPLIWLFAIGAMLVMVTLVVFGSTSGGRPGDAYQPPVLKDGRIVPGRLDGKEAR